MKSAQDSQTIYYETKCEVSGEDAARKISTWSNPIIYFHIPDIWWTVVDGWRIIIEQNVRFQGRMYPENVLTW